MVLSAAFDARPGASENRWFIRLEDASPKDSESMMPVTSLKQLVQILASSMRVRSEIERLVEDGSEMTVYLRPWDEEMLSGIEFRSFIPPAIVSSCEKTPTVASRQFSISAVSQYHCHRPFPAAHSGDASEIVHLALERAERCMPEILEAAKESGTLEELKNGDSQWILSFIPKT